MKQEVQNRYNLQGENGLKIKITPLAYKTIGRKKIKEVIDSILTNRKSNNATKKQSITLFNGIDCFWKTIKNNKEGEILIIYLKHDIVPE